MIRVFEQAVSLNPSFLALRIEVRAPSVCASLQPFANAPRHRDVALDAELAAMPSEDGR